MCVNAWVIRLLKKELVFHCRTLNDIFGCDDVMWSNSDFYTFISLGKEISVFHRHLCKQYAIKIYIITFITIWSLKLYILQKYLFLVAAGILNEWDGQGLHYKQKTNHKTLEHKISSNHVSTMKHISIEPPLDKFMCSV